MPDQAELTGTWEFLERLILVYNQIISHQSLEILLNTVKNADCKTES